MPSAKRTVPQCKNASMLRVMFCKNAGAVPNRGRARDHPSDRTGASGRRQRRLPVRQPRGCMAPSPHPALAFALKPAACPASPVWGVASSASDLQPRSFRSFGPRSRLRLPGDQGPPDGRRRRSRQTPLRARRAAPFSSQQACRGILPPHALRSPRRRAPLTLPTFAGAFAGSDGAALFAMRAMLAILPWLTAAVGLSAELETGWAEEWLDDARRSLPRHRQSVLFLWPGRRAGELES